MCLLSRQEVVYLIGGQILGFLHRTESFGRNQTCTCTVLYVQLYDWSQIPALVGELPVVYRIAGYT